MGYEPPGIHDARNYILNFDGVTFQGFGDGDAISVEAPTETVKAKVGAFGEVAVSLNRNPLYTVKANLHQTSSMNGVLRTMYRDQWQDSRKVLRTMSLTNRVTREVWRGRAFLVQDSGFKVGSEIQNNEWQFGLILDNPGPGTVETT